MYVFTQSNGATPEAGPPAEAPGTLGGGDLSSGTGAQRQSS